MPKLTPDNIIKKSMIEFGTFEQSTHKETLNASFAAHLLFLASHYFPSCISEVKESEESNTPAFIIKETAGLF